MQRFMACLLLLCVGCGTDPQQQLDPCARAWEYAASKTGHDPHAVYTMLKDEARKHEALKTAKDHDAYSWASVRQYAANLQQADVADGTHVARLVALRMLGNCPVDRLEDREAAQRLLAALE